MGRFPSLWEDSRDAAEDAAEDALKDALNGNPITNTFEAKFPNGSNTPAPKVDPTNEGNRKVGCEFKYEATTVDNLVKCKDDTYCEWDFTKPETFECCNNHDGRKICPKNFPTMCAAKNCGGGFGNGDFSNGDFCCEASKYYCDNLYKETPGTRACPEKKPMEP